MTITLNKNEVKELARIKMFLADVEYAQRAADVWMRSAPSEVAQERRKMAVKSLGLDAVIRFS